MCKVNPAYFDLYTKNSQCSLVILYGDNGEISDGKYKSNKIKGRALLWQTDQGDIFLDRIYTNNDSDVNLFINFANENGWWHKVIQNTSHNFTASNGKESKCPTYTITLDECKFIHYPYLDTMCYANFDTDGKISNSQDLLTIVNAELHSTGGYLSKYYYWTPSWECCEYDGDGDEDEDEDYIDQDEDEDFPY
jgi:hypothetical protein